MNKLSGWWIDGCLLSGNGLRKTNYCSVTTELPYHKPVKRSTNFDLWVLQSMTKKERLSVILRCTATR